MATNRPLRIGELLGREVVTVQGERLGITYDVYLCRDGPYVPGFGPALRLHALIVGLPSIASRLGLDQPDTTGPWPLHLWGRRACRRARLVRWEDLELRDDHLLCHRPAEGLEPAYPAKQP